MLDAREFVEAMQYLPQQFDEIVREEGDYRLERCSNDTHVLYRRKNAYRWDYLGDAHTSYPSGKYVVLITKPYDATDDSDARVVYEGDDLDAAIEALWSHRSEAWIY